MKARIHGGWGRRRIVPLMWEHGANANPVEFIDDSGIVRTDVSLG